MTCEYKICLQQSVIPDYRLGFFELLKQEWGSDFQIFAGEADFSGTPVSAEEAWEYYKHVYNIYIFNGRFLWQQDCLKSLLSTDIAILNGNIRVLSNIYVQVLRKVFGRKTILWGHAQGQSRFADAIRGLHLRLCDGFIAYTESQAVILRQRYPWLKVWVAANSCVSSADCVPVQAVTEEVDSFLYVGRLVEKKKVRLLLEGFILAKKEALLPEHVRMVFVGDGAERQSLQDRSQKAGVIQEVDFMGHVSELEKLREYYSRALCAVSPGYVGLSATQSFSFGVSMLVARDEFHSPEIEACKEGFNAEFFTSDDKCALGIKLSEIFKRRVEFIKRRPEISKWTKSHYSFEAMRDTFSRAVNESI